MCVAIGDVSFEGFAVSFEVGNRVAGDSAFGSGLCHGRWNGGEQSAVERFGQDVVGTEFHVFLAVELADGCGHRFACEGRDGMGCGELHGFVDGRCPAIERSTEDIGESKNIIDLVGVVASACGIDEVGACRHGYVAGNLGFRVCEGEHDWSVGHGKKHFGS